MSGFLVRIYVTLRQTVNDPQGLTIQSALHTLGFPEVERVRAGKYLEIQIPDSDEPVARERIGQMCARLLANPVIEDYRFDLSRIEDAEQ